MINVKLLELDKNIWNLTVRKQMRFGSFKNYVTYKLFSCTSYVLAGFGITKPSRVDIKLTNFDVEYN